MRTEIVYGVQGEGRGHATRSLEIIQLLLDKGYRVRIFAGGDAIHFFKKTLLPHVEIPSFRYRYNKKGQLTLMQTLIYNLIPATGLFLGRGKNYRRIRNQIMATSPSVIISDFEPYTCRIASQIKTPLVSINHQHFFTECRIPQQSRLSRTVLVLIFQFSTRLLTGKPNQIIASSFHHFPKLPKSRALLVGPIINKQLKELTATYENHIVVYFKKTEYAYRLLPLFSRIQNIHWKIFADFEHHSSAKLNAPHIEYFAIERESFLKQLAACRGLITTAGNQVLGEAIFLNKPILAFPEPEVVEQELNAQALAISGAGVCYTIEKINSEVLQKFIRKLPPCSSQPRTQHKISYDGSKTVLARIESLLNFAHNSTAKPIAYT